MCVCVYMWLKLWLKLRPGPRPNAAGSGVPVGPHGTAAMAKSGAGGGPVPEQLAVDLEDDVAVLKTIFEFVLGPPPPGGARGRVRTVSFRRESWVWGRFRPGSGGQIYF